MFKKIVIAGFVSIVAWKAWVTLQKPSTSDIRSLSEALSGALCDADLVARADALNSAVVSQAQSLTTAKDKAKVKDMGEAIKMGIEYAQITSQMAEKANPEIRALADPLFARSGWKPQRIYKLLKRLNGQAGKIIELGVAKTNNICPQVRDEETRRASANWILRSYLTTAQAQ